MHQPRQRIALTLGAGLVSFAAAGVSLAATAQATPGHKPRAAASTTAPVRPVLSATPASPSQSPVAVVVVPTRSAAPSTGAGGIQVPAGHVTVTRPSTDDTAPLVLGGVGALLVAGDAGAAVRRRG